jgi:hypothetical protein
MFFKIRLHKYISKHVHYTDGRAVPLKKVFKYFCEYSDVGTRGGVGKHLDDGHRCPRVEARGGLYQAERRSYRVVG